MRDDSGSDGIRTDSGDIIYSGRPDNSWSYRTAEEKATDGIRTGPDSPRDFDSLAAMRKAIAPSDGRDWTDWFIITGAITLALVVLLTLVLSLAINARANRLIENDEIRAKTGGAVVERLEGKLDGLISTVENHVATSPTTTTTVRIPPRTTTTVRRSPVTTVRPSPVAPPLTAPPTTRPRPPTTTTTRPCILAIFDLCLFR